MCKIINKITNKKKNHIKQKYVTNTTIWTVDETFITNNYVVFVIINLKTRCIIGYRAKKILPSANGNSIKYNGNYYKTGLTAEEILELYNTTVQKHSPPIILHADNNPTYKSNEIDAFAKEYNIQLSYTLNQNNGNQVSERTNSSIKKCILTIIQKDSNNRKYRKFRLTWPDTFKNKKAIRRSDDKKFREFVFNSKFFKEQVDFFKYIDESIKMFNSETLDDLGWKFTKEQCQEFENVIVVQTEKLVSSKHSQANQIKTSNINAYKLVDCVYKTIDLATDITPEEKIKLKEEFLVIQPDNETPNILQELHDTAPKDQQNTIQTIILTFKSLSDKAQEIAEKNDKLLSELNKVRVDTKEKDNRMQALVEYIESIEHYEAVKAKRREQRKNRVKRQQTQPFTYQDYIEAINYFKSPECKDYQPITKLRMRVILAIFFCTGLRISELRYITAAQIITLIRKNYIAIDKKKRGPTNHKSFLTDKGKKILQDASYDIIDLCKLTNIEFPDEKIKTYYIEPYISHYIFSSSKNQGKKPFSRAYFTDTFNKMIQTVPYFKENDKNFTSHSLRYGYISGLWRDTADIEFVRQAIGHTAIQTTSGYITSLSESEIQDKMNKIGVENENTFEII